MNNRFLTTLGLARRAGKLCYGSDQVSMGLGKIKLLLSAADIAPRSERNVKRIAAERKIPLIRVPFTKDQLGGAIGTKPVGVLGITESGFAEKLVEMNEGGF